VKDSESSLKSTHYPTNKKSHECGALLICLVFYQGPGG